MPHSFGRETGRTSGKRPDRLGLVAKLLGIATAIFSVIFGLDQLTSFVSSAKQQDRHATELVSVASSEQGAGEYASAWSHLEEAAKLVDATGIFAQFVGNADKDRALVRSRQEDLAMAWLENTRLSGAQQFTDITSKVSPTLALGADKAAGVRRGDLLAHLGWSEFLSARDGVSAANPTTRYREALAADPHNPFALAYLGHWETWRHGSLKTANEYFAAALATGRMHDWVRRMQLSALRNDFPDADASAEYLRVVNAMRINGEPIDEKTRSDVYEILHGLRVGLVTRRIRCRVVQHHLQRFRTHQVAPELLQNWTRSEIVHSDDQRPPSCLEEGLKRDKSGVRAHVRRDRRRGADFF